MHKKITSLFSRMVAYFKRRPAVLVIVTVVLAAAIVVPTVLLSANPTKSAPVANTIFLHNPSIGGGGWVEGGPDIVTWPDIVDHPGFDTAYTYEAGTSNMTDNNPTELEKLAYKYPEGTSGFWNGFVTDSHVVRDSSTVRFLGYQCGTTGTTNNMQVDRFFNPGPNGTPEATTDVFDSMSFTLNPANLNTHTLLDTGYLFNGYFSGNNYTGYMLLLRNNNPNASNVNVDYSSTLQLVYCTNFPMNPDNYNEPATPSTAAIPATPANGTRYRLPVSNTAFANGVLATITVRKVSSGGTVVGTFTPPTIDVRVEREANGAFRLYIDGVLAHDEPTPRNMNDALYSGFGFFTGYCNQHNCRMLTVVQYDGVKFTGYFNNVEGSTRVRFVDEETGTEIADQQTDTDWVGSYYRVDPSQVPTITYGGAQYEYLYSDPPDLDPLEYKRDERVITLYYQKKSAYVAKHASVNGVADDGTPVSPAQVNTTSGSPENIIDYSLEINNTGAAAMVQGGLSEFEFQYNDQSASISNTYNRWTDTNNLLTDSLTNPANASAYQSQYELRRTQGTYSPSGTDLSHVVEMELTGVPPGTYDVYADFTADIRQRTARYLRANAAVRGMVSGSQITSAPLDTSLTSTWGTQLGTLTFAVTSTALVSADFNSAKVGSVTVDATGKAYVSVGIFAQQGTTAMGTATNNWIQSNIYLRSIRLKAAISYAYNDPGISFSDTYNRWTDTNGILSSALTNPANAAAYQSRHVLTRNAGTLSGVVATDLGHVTEMQLTGVPPGIYNVYADFGVDIRQQTSGSRIAANAAVRGMASGSQITSPPMDGSLTGAWGNSLATLTFATTATALQSANYTEAPVGTVVVDTSGTAYVALGIFAQRGASAMSSGNTITTNIYVRDISLVEVKSFELTDVLPSGLTYVTGSASYTDGNGDPTNIDLIGDNPSVSGQELKWRFDTLPAGVTIFRFQARATTAASASTDYMYINRATFVDPRSSDQHPPSIEYTNATYHTSNYIVVEKYFGYEEALLGNELELRTQTETSYLPTTAYYPGQQNYVDIVRWNTTDSWFRSWRYYAYSLDGGNTIVIGKPPEATFYIGGGWNLMDANHEVIFYFIEDVRIDISYLDYGNHSVSVKAPIYVLAPARKAWTLNTSHMRSFSGGSFDWVYRGHNMDGGGFVEGVYPRYDTYAAGEMDDDHEMVLYFEATYDYLPPEKHAYINGSTTPEDGEDGNPAIVPQGGSLKYQLDIYNSHVPYAPNTPVEYDVVFVLDWSESMGGSSYSASPAAGSGRMLNTAGSYVQARTYGAQLVNSLSQDFFSSYPGSRVSVVYTNSGPNSISSYSNSNNPAVLNLQVDTQFLNQAAYTSGNYAASLSAASVGGPRSGYTYDDTAQALWAAVDKLAGEDSVAYGAQNASLPNHFVKIRDDFTRIPVIVLISDFQMTEAADGVYNNTGANYWTGAMKDAADHFNTILPYGTLMTVRLDHDQAAQSSTFSSSAYDTLMQDNVSPAGRSDWLFTSINDSTLFADALTTVSTMLKGSLPAAGGPLIVSDVIPEGLTIGPVSHGGVFDEATRTITWDLSDEPKGMIRVTIETTAATGGLLFENSAHVLWPTGGEDETNTTYHQAPQRLLHVRQVVVDPITALEQPPAGFLQLTNDSDRTSIMCLSGKDSDATLGYTTYSLPVTADQDYLTRLLVPQYYSYDGFVLSAENGDHDKDDRVPIAAANGQIKLEYDEINGPDELWLTLYITPTDQTLGHNSTEYITNKIGQIFSRVV